MDMLLDWLGREEVQTAVLAVAALGFVLLKRLQAVKAWRLTKALECVEAGVRATYEEYVRSIKAARADGKLTDGERREAMNRALDRAKEYAAREGVDLLRVYAKEYLPVLAEKIVRRFKAETDSPLAVVSVAREA